MIRFIIGSIFIVISQNFCVKENKGVIWVLFLWSVTADHVVFNLNVFVCTLCCFFKRYIIHIENKDRIKKWDIIICLTSNSSRQIFRTIFSTIVGSNCGTSTGESGTSQYLDYSEVRFQNNIPRNQRAMETNEGRNCWGHFWNRKMNKN